MGTFIGHISPGLAFLSFGFLWAFKYSYLYQKDKYIKRKSSEPPGRCMRILTVIPWEAIMKLVYGTLAALAEFFFPLGVNKLEMFKNGELQHPNEWQHFTMYSYFAISGIVDIISQKVLKRRAPSLEKLFLALAFGVESLLLYNHRHGKDMMENNIHILVFIAAFGSTITTALEIWNPKAYILPFMTAGFALLQGSWFFHAAFIIYRQEWDPSDHSGVMFVTMAYCWHMAMDMLIMAIVYGLMYVFFGRRWRKRYQADSRFSDLSEHKINGINQFQEEETEFKLMGQSDED
ncbi:transmembrane protein 45B-like [Glandiceps talaboti]